MIVITERENNALIGESMYIMCIVQDDKRSTEIILLMKEQ